MDKRVKQKLLDRMNKVSKNNFGYIWGGNPGLAKKNIPGIFYDVMKSPNKDYLFDNNFYCNSKIISNENSKIEERDFYKKENIQFFYFSQIISIKALNCNYFDKNKIVNEKKSKRNNYK